MIIDAYDHDDGDSKDDNDSNNYNGSHVVLRSLLLQLSRGNSKLKEKFWFEIIFLSYPVNSR